jgi:quercetin dioxygenase-like cupin family protein
MASYGLVRDRRAQVEVPTGGILSRTIHEDDAVTLTLFAFDAGQELTEHTSSRAALVEVLEGEADVRLGEDEHVAGPGAWISMPPGLPHAIRARSPMVMALTLLKPRGAPSPGDHDG